MTAALRRRCLRVILLVPLLLAASVWIGVQALLAQTRTAALAALNTCAPTAGLAALNTCAPTAGGTLTVCHAPAQEGVFATPGPDQIAYNVQIVDLGNGHAATVLHSEAEDMLRLHAQGGGFRPGDSIKTGIADTRAGGALTAPPLDFRVWGTLTNTRSPLYYAFQANDPRHPGVSGGANPMVVRGRPNDPYTYMFFLGVSTDGNRGIRWRNRLLQARTKDFLSFDILQPLIPGQPAWAPFEEDTVLPTVLTDTAGHPIVSNQPAIVEDGSSANPLRPKGAVLTSGLIGSIAHVQGTYYYFYTDQDAGNPAQSHLYVRTAADISGPGRWSEPRIVMDTPPEILIRVAKARDADRWAVFYSCLRVAEPAVTDVCLQYTNTLSLAGPDGIAGLTLFDTPYTGHSPHALGLIGKEVSFDSHAGLRIQQMYMTDLDGNLTAPAGTPPTIGGVVTWTELPSNLDIFGAPVYWGEWTVTSTR